MDKETRIGQVDTMTQDERNELCNRIARMNLEEYPMTARDFAHLVREIKEGE